MPFKNAFLGDNQFHAIAVGMYCCIERRKFSKERNSKAINETKQRIHGKKPRNTFLRFLLSFACFASSFCCFVVSLLYFAVNSAACTTKCNIWKLYRRCYFLCNLQRISPCSWNLIAPVCTIPVFKWYMCQAGGLIKIEQQLAKAMLHVATFCFTELLKEDWGLVGNWGRYGASCGKIVYLPFFGVVLCGVNSI